jgi:hypothetical protein
MNMKIFHVLVAVVFSSAVFAQDAPQVGHRPLLLASEISTASPTSDPQTSLPAQATGTPDQKR